MYQITDVNFNIVNKKQQRDIKTKRIDIEERLSAKVL